MRGTLGVGSGYNDSLYMNRPHLAGQGAFGNIEVDLRKIAELTFATTARNSRTFKSLPSQKAGGPFLVSADTATLKVETIFGAAGFDPRANAFVAAKLEVGGVSFEPDFALISRVSITSVSYGTSRAEFVNRSGEQLVGPLASPSRNGLFGESGAGLVFVSLSKPVRIERQ